MPVDQRDAWVRAYLEDVFNGHNLQSLDKYMTENLVSHWLGDRSLQGREAWRDAMANFFDAFPDAAYTLNDLFFAGDKGVWRGTWHATQRKEWEGIPATGRKAKWTVVIIGRFEGDKLGRGLGRVRPLQSVPPARRALIRLARHYRGVDRFAMLHDVVTR